jgi:hypothetical protein
MNIYKYGLRFADKRTLLREDGEHKVQETKETKHEQEESDNLEK